MSSYQRDLKALPGDHKIDATKYADFFREIAASPVPDPIRDFDAYLELTQDIAHSLPREILRRIDEFKRTGNSVGALIITGLPTDPQLPPTPPDSRRSPGKNTFVSELWIGAFAAAVGDLFAYRQQNNGEMFADVCPVQKMEQSITGESSKAQLTFHTDGASHPLHPDFILFSCLRGDHDKVAKTIIATAESAAKKLSPELQEMLFRPIFEIMPDVEFGDLQEQPEVPNQMVPILYPCLGRPIVRFDGELFVQDDPKIAAMVAAMETALEATWDYVNLQAGDFMILDNRHSVHGRTPFTPRYDGTDRWLQTSYACRDLFGPHGELTMTNRVVDVPAWAGATS